MYCDKHNIEYEQQQRDICGRLMMFGSCPECDKEADEMISEKELREKKISELRAWKDSNIEEAYFSATFDSYIVNTDEQKKAKETVMQLVQNRSGKIIMLGKNGTGKTHLAVCAVKELGGKILTMYEISTRIRATYTQKATETELDIVDELARAKMLVIDEIGRTKGSDAETNWLSYIIDKRHTRSLPLILISNKHIRRLCPAGGCADCLENYLSEDIMSRLSDGGVRLQFTGDDWRKK
jgi:DNA replication protein DnaC